jgi:hypothetical protein
MRFRAKSGPGFLAVGFLTLIGSSAALAQTAVPRWQNLLRPSSPGERNPEVLAARELADGTVMVVTDSLVAYRYDHDGNPVSAIPLRVTASGLHRGGSPSSESPSGSDLPGYGRDYAVIDAFGVVALARIGDRDFDNSPVTSTGDIVTDRFDGLTGKSLWGAPAIFDTGTNRADYPTGVFLDGEGDVYVTGLTESGAVMDHVSLKYSKLDGSVVWGPELIATTGKGTATLGPGGLWVSVPFTFTESHLTTVRYSLATGAVVFGPVTTQIGDFGQAEASVAFGGGLIVVGYSGNSPFAILYGISDDIVWGPTEYPPTNGAERFLAAALDSSGHVLVAGRAATVPPSGLRVVTLARIVAETGELEWTKLVSPRSPQDPEPWVAAAGNGDAVLAALALNDQDQVVLETWRFLGSDGSLVWGPESVGRAFDNPFSPAPPFAALIASNGRVFEAQRLASDVSAVTNVFELEGATGVPAWGPTPIASLPIDGGRLWDIASSPDGSLAVVGDDRLGNMVTYKYSRTDGSFVWGPSVLEGGSGYQAQFDSAGNVVVLADGFEGVRVVKYAAADGSTIWGPILVSGGNSQRLALDPAGNPVVLFWDTGKGSGYDAGVAKLSGATGAFLWGPVLYNSSDSQSDFARALAISPAGDVFVVGDTWPTSPPIHWFALKYSGVDGTLLWGPGPAIEGTPFGAASDASGNLVATGSGGLTTVKYNGASGALLWGPVSVPPDGFSEGRAIGVNGAGDVCAFGTIGSDLATACYSGADGHVLWGPRLFDGEAGSFDIANDLGIAFDFDDNVVVGGYSRTLARGFDLVTFKYDGETGTTLWGPAYVGTYDAEERMNGFSVLGDSVVVGGSSQGGLLFAGLDEQFGIQTIPPDPPPAACGVPYSFTFTAANGTTSYSWSITSGELPEGLLLSPTGILSGVTTEQGRFAFTVHAQDSAAHAVDRAFELVVGEGNITRIQQNEEQCGFLLTVVGTFDSYLWLPGGETTPEISVEPLEATTYGAIVSDASGCVQHLGTLVPGIPLQRAECEGIFLIGLDPLSGPAAGAAITISGINFQDGAAVLIGGLPANDVVVVAPNQLTATTPGLEPGPLNDVTVVNPNGSNDSLLRSFLADFNDVPTGSLFHDDVTILVKNGITAGCGGGNYCPANPVTRAQMAVFLLKSLYGASYVPPPAIGLFLDVPQDDPFAPWIEKLHELGVTAGCGGDYYCPGNPVTRAQMAVFLLKTREGATYTPPSAIGVFGDVPASDPFAPWIEEIYSRNITGGCSAAPLLYCPASPVTRGQMAPLLVKTFQLQ